MNKKNSGFSLVELIVVIAIMAVLVGVLAPAYLKYVEKSRKSADIDALDELVAAAEKVVVDEDYEDYATEGSTFTITFGSHKATISAATHTEVTDLKSAWMELANIKSDSVTLKSKAYKNEEGTITGTVKNSGGVSWVTSGLTKIVESDKTAKDFLAKLNS